MKTNEVVGVDCFRFTIFCRFFFAEKNKKKFLLKKHLPNLPDDFKEKW